jgi:hypothetical protein
MFLDAFGQAFAANPAQNPQLVADALLALIETPYGQRAFRTIVDRMGLGDQVAPYNDQLESITQNIYKMFDIDYLLRVGSCRRAAAARGGRGRRRAARRW